MFDVECRCGRRHYGLFGAAGLVLRDEAGLILMTLRSVGVSVVELHPDLRSDLPLLLAALDLAAA